MNTFQTYHNLNIVEKLAFIGYTPEEVTTDTYLYIDEDENICGMEKRDRQSQPEDLLDGGEYVVGQYASGSAAMYWAGREAKVNGIDEIRDDLRQLLAICE